MITQENAKQWLPLMAALAEGKLERIEHGEWRGVEFINTNMYSFDFSLFRIAPEKKRIPLTAEDIPPVCWVRLKDCIAKHWLVTGVLADGILLSTVRHSYTKLLCDGEMSTDRKTWLPCWKEVQ